MSNDPQQMTDDLPPTSCIDEASTRLQDLLRVTCEMPLSQLAGLATDHGVRPIDLLTRVEGSGTCFLDYGTGHVRCTPAPVEELRPIKAEAPDDAPI